MKFYERLERTASIYEKAANVLNIILNLMILGAIGAQVITRTFFDMPLKFPEEVSIFALIAMIYCGVGIVERHEEYLRVEVFQNYMPRKVRNALQLASKFLLLVLIFGILQGEFAIFPSIAMLKSIAAKIPYSWLHGWIILFSFIWGIWVILDTWQMIQRIKSTGCAEILKEQEEI